MMDEHIPAPVGTVEPHAGMLSVPRDEELLFKVMGLQNFLSSMREKYLHSNRLAC
jgi:hypothetical protein